MRTWDVMRSRVVNERLIVVTLISVALVLCAIGAYLWVSAASRATAAELESAVRDYSELLAWGYANLDMNRLTTVATPEQARR
jgi:hypothetical protein